MSLELNGLSLEVLATRVELLVPAEPAPDPAPAPAAPEARLGASERSPEHIERLARQLALANGEDPDEQPFPLRFPRWRFHCARAKALLSISPAEHRALAAVLPPEPDRQPTGSPPHR